MKILRSIIFWSHLVTALFVGIVVLLMSVTGVLLTYQRQITAWADTRGLDGSAPAGMTQRLSGAEILERVQSVEEGTPTAYTRRSDPAAPAEVVFGRDGRVLVNAYTGEVLGRGSDSVRAFFRSMTDWHRWLAREGEERALGRGITGAANLGFLFLVVSGFYLWWPRNWNSRALANVLLFRRGVSGKVRDFNWHNVIGFWSAIPLFIIVFSGVMISYPWATALVYRIAGDVPPAAVAPPPTPAANPSPSAPERPERPSAAPSLRGTESLEFVAERQVPEWRSITMQIPNSPEADVSFNVDAGDGGQPHLRGALTLGRVSGEVVNWEPFSSGTPGRQLRSFLRFAHTGEVGGLLGQTLAGLVSFGAIVLVWTGFALSWRRFGAWRSRGGGRRPRVEREPRVVAGVGGRSN